jgi:hypothetical protein
VTIGYVRLLRKAGSPAVAVWLYKAVVTLDAPLLWLVKCGQYAGRRLSGRAAKAEKSRLAARGLWHFVRRGLGRFWRA